MKKTALLALLMLGLFFSGAVEAKAVSKFTLNPASGTYKVGDNIDVMVGVDSGTDKVYTADLWMVFDASKLEFVDAVVAASPAFLFTKGVNNSDNTAGTLQVQLAPVSSNSNEATTAKGDLVKLTFKAKAVGTGTLSFSCTNGSTIDANIINEDITDVVSCAANQSGSYTIQASTGGDSGTVAPTSAVVAPTKVPSELPQTGILTPTISLIVIGLVGIIASAFLLL